MASELSESAELIAKFSSLGKADQKSILGRLSPEERLSLEMSMRAEAATIAEEEERQRKIDRQFLGYTAWLADLVEGTQDSVPDQLTPKAAKTIWQEHEALIAAKPLSPRSGLRGLIDQLADLFSGSPDKTK